MGSLRHWVRLDIAPNATGCQLLIAVDAKDGIRHHAVMTLQQYLAIRGNTGVALAKSMGVSCATVSRWASGHQQMTVDTLRSLYIATGGKVKPNDFLEK